MLNSFTQSTYFRFKLLKKKKLLIIEKIKCIEVQNFEDATNFRDAERELDKVLKEEKTFESFLSYIKNCNYSNFNQIYGIIKPLERKIKLEKLRSKI